MSPLDGGSLLADDTSAPRTRATGATRGYHRRATTPPWRGLMEPEYFDAAPTDWVDPGDTAMIEVDGWPVGLANVDGDVLRLLGAVPPPGHEARRGQARGRVHHHLLRPRQPLRRPRRQVREARQRGQLRPGHAHLPPAGGRRRDPDRRRLSRDEPRPGVGSGAGPGGPGPDRPHRRSASSTGGSAMATTRRATTHWEGSLMEGAGQVTLESSGQGLLRRDVGVTGRGPQRSHEPRGAHRGRPLVVLLDGAVQRAGQGGHAAATLDTSAEVTFQPGQGITGIVLRVHGVVPGMTRTPSRPPPRTPRPTAR